MAMEETCQHCGATGDPQTIQVEHRGCRLKAAFPGAYTEEGGLISFDMASIQERLGIRDGVTTKVGVTFHRDDLAVWVEMPVRYGNNLTALSWRIPLDEWAQVVEQMGGIHHP